MLTLMIAPMLIMGSVGTVTGRAVDRRAAAAIGLGILFAFTGVGHFAQTEPMVRMLPSWIPQRELLVYLSGALEFAIAVGFFVPKTRRLAAWSAAAVLVLFFPVNVYAALQRIPVGGHGWGPVYLLIRGPLQLMILAWIYWFLLRRSADGHAKRRP
jgi:uncharacterized membrane protein